MTEEIKISDYESQIQAYIKNKERIEGIINHHKSAISALEKEIETLRPKTENGKELVCKSCNPVNMRCVGYIAKNGNDINEDIPVYMCESCGKTNL